MKRILKSELDKFYTKPNIAIDLISKLDLSLYSCVVDPSCGSGSFYSNINHQNKIGIDLLPEMDGVIRHDFLTWDYTNIGFDNKDVLVLTNPPFGKQGSLSMKFIKRSLEFSNTIGMILPLSFVKDSVKDRVPLELECVYEEILPPNSFLLDGEDYDVKCVFQIWKRTGSVREKTEQIKPIGFIYDNKTPDISIRRVGIYAGKAFIDTDKSKQSHYFIRINDKSKIDYIVESLNNKKWEDFTVGPRSISKNELNQYLNSILNEKRGN